MQNLVTIKTIALDIMFTEKASLRFAERNDDEF